MKVCFVTDSYPPNVGGAEIVIQNIVEGIAKYGIGTIVITTKPYNSSSLKSYDKSKVIRIYTPKFLRRLWFLILSFPYTLYYAKDADLIHGTSYGGILQTYIAGKFLGKPTVLTVHEFMGKNWFRFTNNYPVALFYQLAEKIFAKLSFSKFIAVSNFTKNKLIEAGIPHDKIVQIYNGESYAEIKINKSLVETKTELGLNSNDFVFAAYGRTGITKGFEYLVDAIPSVLGEIQSSKFLLILTQDDKRIWKKINNNLKKIDKNRIIIFNSLEKETLFNYLNVSDVIIIPSLSEGFGFTTLESGMLKKDIIASNVGAIPEVISGNYILFEPQSSEAIKIACIRAFHKEFKYKEPMTFNWTDSIKSYLKLYKEIIN